VQVDRLDAAEYWYERALESDPNGVTAITEAAEFFAQTGRPQRAYQLIADFETLRSPNTGAWQTVREIHAILGNEDQEERARLCATQGQSGCWTAG
jgi:predicted Zn-dependent protease